MPREYLISTRIQPENRDWNWIARGFALGARPALAAKRMHQIVRMIFAAKAGRAPRA